MGLWDTISDIWNDTVDSIRDAAKVIAEAVGFTERNVYQYFYAPSRLISDDDIPDQTHLVSEMIKAVSYGTPISDVIRLDAMSGSKSLLKSYMRYGEETYVNGLPTFGFKSPPMHMTKFRALVNTALGTYIPNGSDEDALYSVGIPIPYDLALAYLQKDHGYTDHMVISGNTYVLYGAVIEIFTILELAADPLKSNTTDALLVRYPSAGAPVYETVHLSIPTATEYKEYYQYRNVVVFNDFGTYYTFPFVFVYPFNYSGPTGAETPDMTISPVELSTATSDAIKIMPIVAFKRDGAVIAEGDATYATSVKLLNKLNLDYDSLWEDITDGAATAGTDMDNVYDAFFLCSLSPYSELKETKEYFYGFFRLLYEVMAKDSYQKEQDIGNPTDASSNSFKITENNYNVELKFRYIRKEYVTGTVAVGADIGDIVRVIDYRADGYYTTGYTIEDNGMVRVETPVIETYSDSRLVFRRQLNTTTYEQITVVGPKLLTMVLNVAEDKKWGNVMGMVPEGHADANKFLIPMSYAFLNLFGINNVERILYESMNLVFMGYATTHLEWFETQSFMNFTIIVVTVVAFIYGGGQLADMTIKQIVQQLFVQAAMAEAFKRMIAATDLSDVQKAVLMVAYIAVATKLGEIDTDAVGGLGDLIVLSITTISNAITLDSSIKLEAETERAIKDAASYKSKSEHNQDIADGLVVDDEFGIADMTMKRPLNFEYVEQFLSRKTMRDTASIARDYASTYVSSFIDSDMLMAS